MKFTVGGESRSETTRCDYMTDFATEQKCGAPGAYWYPSLGGGVAVLCEAHGTKHFPIGAQRITDTTWHGGGEPVPTAAEGK